MNPLLRLLTGDRDYIGIVKEFIEKIFVHEAKKYGCETNDLRLIVYHDGKIEIGTYSVPENKVWRVIPDKEVQDILMK
jgi:hypothetical protein